MAKCIIRSMVVLEGRLEGPEKKRLVSEGHVLLTSYGELVRAKLGWQ
jgi:hypothetical protein